MSVRFHHSLPSINRTFSLSMRCLRWEAVSQEHDAMPRLMRTHALRLPVLQPLKTIGRRCCSTILPDWLVISDPKTVNDFYEGNVNFFADGYVRYWVTPILSWSIVIFSLMLIFLCLTSLIRRQWVDREKLAYPIIQIPLEITADSGAHLQESCPVDRFWALPSELTCGTGLRIFSLSSPLCPSMTAPETYSAFHRNRGMRWAVPLSIFTRT